VLRIAAREADIVGINGTLTGGAVDAGALASMTATAVEEKVVIVREAAGDRIHDIELNVRVFYVAFTDDRRGASESIAQALGVAVPELLASPFALIGTPAQMAEDLRERRERWGFSYVIVGADDIDAFAPVVAELAGER
jgi:alkanesulfonate monooxygenase SsuD/methylene tetrahydromethanopterin reductase-like flavin-dependent oxidoreductase (luciferase family)